MVATFAKSLWYYLKINIFVGSPELNTHLCLWLAPSRVTDAVVFNVMAFWTVRHYFCPGLAAGVGVVSSPAFSMLPSDDKLKKTVIIFRSPVPRMEQDLQPGIFLRCFCSLQGLSSSEYSFMHQIAHFLRKMRTEAFQCCRLRCKNES